jgi:hypothetical protein
MTTRLFYDGTDVTLLPPKPFESYILDRLTRQWVDPRNLQDYKSVKWAELKQARNQAEYSGFYWKGFLFDSDALSQQRITNAVILAQIDSSFSVNWILADNTTRLLNASELKEISGELVTHVTKQFSRTQALRSALNSATTKHEVEAINW